VIRAGSRRCLWSPAVVDAVSPLPVIAAGGIADGRGIAAALMLGTEGVWIGTRFLGTTECGVSDAYKARVVAASGDASGAWCGSSTRSPGSRRSSCS
jgi:NAD(P)H-dependent flavin oxidoreductase YrpB (nitropropane dioxygenase family)